MQHNDLSTNWLGIKRLTSLEETAEVPKKPNPSPGVGEVLDPQPRDWKPQSLQPQANSTITIPR